MVMVMVMVMVIGLGNGWHSCWYPETLCSQKLPQKGSACFLQIIELRLNPLVCTAVEADIQLELGLTNRYKSKQLWTRSLLTCRSQLVYCIGIHLSIFSWPLISASKRGHEYQ